MKLKKRRTQTVLLLIAKRIYNMKPYFRDRAAKIIAEIHNRAFIEDDAEVLKEILQEVLNEYSDELHGYYDAGYDDGYSNGYDEGYESGFRGRHS